MLNYLPPRISTYSDELVMLFPDQFPEGVKQIRTITFQVTENCCLNCSYCYQIHNDKAVMTFETIKPFLKKLLNNEIEGATTEEIKGVIWEFIGGEPFMNIDVIFQITDYIFNFMINNNHPWLQFSRISISSNGILYFQPKVQEYLKKYCGFISLGISLDGSKELHDACRVDLNGNGSYDRVMLAIRDYRKRFNKINETKMTFSPENIQFLYESYLSLINEGFTMLQGNCVFEQGWEYKDATILYYELKKLADYLIDSDLYNKIYVSFFDEELFKPMKEDDNDNWCGGLKDYMMAIDYKGDIYNCIRYMETSLQGKQKPLIIGDINNGINVLPEHQENYKMISADITRRSQSTDECFYCPIATGCAWCSAYNYQVFGTPNKRATFICCMHKARALANVYYWNKLYKKLKINKKFKNYLTEDQVLQIISKDELDLLNNL